jgi:hypothetical protein
MDITEHDKEVIENIVNDLSGYLRPAIEEGQMEDIFDNKILDVFMKNLILTLNDIRNEGSISKYVDASGNLKVEV